MTRSNGTVISVVAKAISTSIENSGGERIPKSNPTFKATSSTRPRVFNRTPSASESRSPNRIRIAPVNPQPILPAIAAAMTATE